MIKSAPRTGDTIRYMDRGTIHQAILWSRAPGVGCWWATCAHMFVKVRQHSLGWKVVE